MANAGISESASTADQTVEPFDEYFAVNVRAPYFLVQQLLPQLQDGANVVLVSSLAAVSAVANLSAYSATKGVVDTLVKHFVAALGPLGVRVNPVAPGIIDTDMSGFTKMDAGRDYAIAMGAEARGQGRGYRRRGGVPGFRWRAVDCRHHYSYGWRI